MAANVNKGNSAKEALAVFGLGIDEAVAFGDGMNDFEMLSMADRDLRPLATLELTGFRNALYRRSA